MKKHITYFDFVRGIAILMVVSIHTFNSTANFETFQGGFQIVFRQILNCAVPIFLALSGFFLGRKTFESKHDIIHFWKKQTAKVYIPCLLWSIPLFISRGITINNLVSLFICGYGIYYFIALIIQYYVLLPRLIKYKKKWLFISLFVSVISIIVITYVISIKGISLPPYFICWPFHYMVCIFYVRGLLF